MNLRLQGFVLLIFVVLGTSAKPRVEDDQELPKLDDAKSKSLKSDADDFDGGSGDYEDEEDDEEYFFDDYNDEDGSGEYDDDDEDYDDEEDGTTGRLIPDPYPKEEKGGYRPAVEDDWHFEDGTKEKNHDGLLYEYYNEIYDEDYDLSDVEKDTVKPKKKGKGVEEEEEEGDSTDYAPTEKVLNTSNLMLMVVSGFASFAICTLAFFVCCYRQKNAALGKRVQAIAPFYISPSLGPNGHKDQGASTTIRCFAPPSTSIVKNYHLVPQDAKEFISSSVMVNSTQRSSPESEKPLLP